MDASSFFTQPYTNRQLIVFLDEVTDLTPPESLSQEWKESSTWVKVATIGSILYFPLLVVPAWKFGSSLLKKFSKKQPLLEQNQALKIVPVLITDAGRLGFDLPPGHPQKKVIYAGHPYVPQMYKPLSDFQLFVFEAKVRELLTLLIALGAKTVQVIRTAGSNTEIATKAEARLPGIFGGAGLNTNMIRATDRAVAWNLTLRKPQHPPTVPPNLMWFQDEQDWQWIATNRNSLQDFSLNVKYGDSFGISTEVKLKLEQTGLSFGGMYQTDSSSAWSVAGEFWDP